MSELENLKARQQELLDKIQMLNEQCEGKENEHNAQKLQELNKVQAQLIGNQNNLKQQLQLVQEKIKTINNEIDKLSSTATDRILEAIKNQRWYFFKNKPHILMDKTTGIIWANLDCFPWNKGEDPNDKGSMYCYEFKEAEELLKKYITDNIPNWEFPKKQELIHFVEDKSCPFIKENSSDYRLKGYKFWITIEKTPSNEKFMVLKLDELKNDENRDNAFLIPCSYHLIQNNEYEKNISENNHIYTEKERLRFTLDLFRKNELWPIFDDAEITDLYKKIYFEKPRLLQALSEVETQLAQCEEVKTISANFDYTTLLNKYDIASIDKSIIKYYEAVQKWIDELMEYLADFEQQKESVIQDCNQIGLQLSTTYKDDSNLTEAENELLKNRQYYFKDKLALGMDKVKTNLLKVKQQADDIEYTINEIDDGDNAIYELAQLEKKERASFALIAENTAKIVNKALQKIDFFEHNRDFIVKAVEVWYKWNEDYKVFKTKQYEELKHSCEEDDIEAEVWQKWYEDWQKLRFTIEEKLQPMISRGLKGDIETKEEQEIPIIMQAIYVLNDYKIAVDNFYLEERKNIYQQYVFQNCGDLQEKFEVEKELYARTVNLQKALQNIIFNCKKEADKIFILRWIDNLIDIQINEIIQFVADNNLEQISQEVLNEFAKLKQKNYYMYLADIKAYSQEQANREKAYNSLIFKMRKGLMKK
ncbi:hypothetical protein DWZ11_02290 [Megamonas rupellensis]|mgnify:FL=1|uniref:Uncharacterized protein n=1 Tax=Megamonas rupellensis TaxID=491921 RepID=A0A411ZZ78_9FIRM|nr:hypothetical protein [Megamonas rupellensis]RGQ08146.1 hypothetical protein DWZ11_02290 [Megamonas rupellensis]